MNNLRRLRRRNWKQETGNMKKMNSAFLKNQIISCFLLQNFRSKAFIRWIFGVMVIGMVSGCASKLVRIDSSPAFAEIRINNEYVGKTPMYLRFYDKWYPLPIKKTDDYMIQAQLPGYEPEVQIFHESPERLDISYVPDEVFFKMHPLKNEKEINP